MSESDSSGDDFDEGAMDAKEESDEDSSDDQLEELDEKKVAQLKEKLCENPYDYDSHVELISLYRSAGDLDKVREARESMSQRFPLSPDLWMEWINDEMCLVSDESDKKYVMELFERATKDYVSPDVWLEFVQFSIGLIGSDDGVKQIREVFEKAVAAAGLHVQKGCLLWEAYREFENSVVGMSKSEDLVEQYKRIYNLFKRQFSIPLMFMEDKYDEFEMWISEVKDANVEFDVETVKYGFNKALTELQKIKPYEDALISTEKPQLDDYYRYIEYEEANGTPPRVQSIYERAVVDHCLEPQLWLNYTKYVDEKIKIPEVSVAVYERAVRNCAWVAGIWVNYIKSLERSGKEKADILPIFERALVAGFQTAEEYRQLWLSYLDCCRRKTNWGDEKGVESLRKSFEAAIDHLNTIEGGDANCTVLQYLAKVEAKFCKNIENFRKIWNERLLTQRALSSQAELWIEYANRERIYGDELHYKKVLLKGLQQANDWPELIGELLVKYCREEGDSISDVDTAVGKYEKTMRYINKKRQDAAKKEAKKEDGDNKKSKTEVRPKRKHPDTEAAAAKAQAESKVFKVPLAPSGHGPTVAKKPKNSEEKGQGRQSTSSESAKEATQPIIPSYIKPKGGDEGLKELQTVFVSNLNFKTDQDQIRERFSQFGEINEVRLVRNYKGLSKGFCYVEYTSVQSCKEALKHDRMVLDGRPIYITQMGRKADFKYKLDEEPNKLFVSNLERSTSVDEVRQLFEQYGELKDVRLITYRNGHPKGHAYVEYQDELGARKALKADGMLMKDRNIKVAISNPSKKKESFAKPSKTMEPGKSLGSASLSANTSGHARQKINIPLVPLAVRKSMAHINGSAASGSETSKPLSNADFRSLLNN